MNFVESSEVEYCSNGTARRKRLLVYDKSWDVDSGRSIRFYGKRPTDINSMIYFLVKREDEPTNEARVEPNSFRLYLARRRKNIIQRAQENQELQEQ